MKGVNRRWVADRAAAAGFVVATVIGWVIVGLPGSGRGHDTRLLYDGIVVVAAFVIAAVIQKVIMADYAIKAGPGGVELGPLRDVKESTAEISEATRKLVTEVGRNGSELEAARTRIKALEDAYLANIKDLDDRLGRLEEESRSRD